MVGEELSPGVKKGGYLNLIQRRVNCVGPASAIPKELELDVSSLDFGQRINLSGLNLPAEVSIAGVVGTLPALFPDCLTHEHAAPACICSGIMCGDHCRSCGQYQQELSLMVARVRVLCRRQSIPYANWQEKASRD